jgi:hypothetical protein
VIYDNTQGIRLNDPLCLLREELCQEILSKFDSPVNQNICLIEAPPCSGKTSTITMLKEYLEKTVKDVVVIRKNFFRGIDVDASMFIEPGQPTFYLIDEM